MAKTVKSKTPIPIEIKKADWFPPFPTLEYPDDLWEWINSINQNFKTKKKYKPFEVYKQQAYKWLEDKDSITDYIHYDEQVDFITREFNRCRDNTLYFANKYGFIKEGEMKSGFIKYIAWEAQEIVLFLFDCNFSLMIGKARQVGFTSTMGLCSVKRINFNKSYFVKFITHNTTKGQEIFRDKIKPGFSQAPEWIKQEVFNDTGVQLNLAVKNQKGLIEGFNSRIEVGSPAEDAINGGSPNLVLIDEIGLFPMFALMMAEGRPALFFTNPITKKIEMKRQVVGWGTGGSGGGAVFENEFKSALDAWEKKNFQYGIIPLFFNAYARIGITEKELKSEREIAYSKMGIDKEAQRVKYHQAYPMTLDDMFLRSSETMVPVNQINQHILKIAHLDENVKPVYGYFDPIYDKTIATPHLFYPYKIIGVDFVKTDAMDDAQTTTCLFRQPVKGWKWRYFKGTDPINSETGKSKFSSSVWDAYENTVSACLFYRTRDFKECYAQSMLMGIYFSDAGEWKELIESNIGDAYVDFLEQHGFGRCIVANGTLPVLMQTPSSKWWGISNRTNTANKIINKLKELCQVYIDNIYILWFFLQLKTFIEKELKGASNSNRLTRYQAADLRYDRDDAVFSITFAYTCAEAYAKYDPLEISVIQKESKYKIKTVQNAGTGYSPRLAQVDEKGRVVRYLNAKENRR